MHGYQIISELDERTAGAWKPSPGSVYPTLQMLEDEGLVHAVERDGKKTFELTDEGRAAAEERAGETAPWDSVRGEVNEDALSLMHAAKNLGVAVMQVAQAGTPEQTRAAKELLDRTRKDLFKILAED